jgi:hypothetical protein
VGGYKLPASEAEIYDIAQELLHGSLTGDYTTAERDSMTPGRAAAVEHRRLMVNAWAKTPAGKRPKVTPPPTPPAGPVGKEYTPLSGHGADLRWHFASLKAPLEDQPRPDIMSTLRDLLMDAGDHPASPLVARDIIVSLIKIRKHWLEGKNAAARKPSPVRSKADSRSRAMWAAHFDAAKAHAAASDALSDPSDIVGSDFPGRTHAGTRRTCRKRRMCRTRRTCK